MLNEIKIKEFDEKRACSKIKSFCYKLFLWGWRKIVQNGQTEPKPWLWVTRRRTKVRREAKFVRSKKA